MTAFLGMEGFRWMLVLVVLQGMLLMPDAFVGHYRSGFTVRLQYAPFMTATFVILTAAIAAIIPGTVIAPRIAVIAGVTALASGTIGTVYHHWYGLTTKPGGYRWTLHHLMHHAPPLAPLTLATAGALEALAALGLLGATHLWGMSLRGLSLTVVSLTLVGATLQIALLHYRGAYNNVVMYLPVVLLPVAAAAVTWSAIMPDAGIAQALGSFLLVLTFLAGFLGSGMHLRGADRQMGGLYIGVAAVLDAPPAGAPLFVATIAASGLVAMRLL